MTQQQHMIGRTILEIDCDRLEEVWSLQQDMSDLFQRGLPAIAQLFDHLVGVDEVVRLDRVVVQLDSTDRHHLADDFMPNLLTALQVTLSDRLNRRSLTDTDTLLLNGDRGEPPTQRTDPARNRSDRTTLAGESSEDFEEIIIRRNRAGADWEALLYFLQYGRLPWWCPAVSWQHWLDRWGTIMQTGNRWQVPLRELLRNISAARQRLVAQFPEAFRHQVVLQLQPTWSQWSSLLVQVRQLIQALCLGDRTAQHLHTQAWLFVLSELIQSDSLHHSFPKTHWMNLWLSELLREIRIENLQDFRDNSNFNGMSVLSRSSPQVSLSSITNTNEDEEAIREQTEGAIAHDLLHRLIASLSLADQPLWLMTLDQILSQGEWQQTQLVGAAKTSLKGEQAPVESSPLSLEEARVGLFIQQAGLVILHPFLQPFFAVVNLWNGTAFRDETAQQTAIYLLHYLATGKTNSPEYDLTIPKLLCGWPLNEPVTCELPLSEAARTEAEELLQTVINYWQALKSTSPDGLREGFLQRGGKLTQMHEGDWKLQVEQQAIDILLGSLPWGFNVVKLPWMDSMLMVEWS